MKRINKIRMKSSIVLTLVYVLVTFLGMHSTPIYANASSLEQTPNNNTNTQEILKDTEEVDSILEASYAEKFTEWSENNIEFANEDEEFNYTVEDFTSNLDTNGDSITLAADDYIEISIEVDNPGLYLIELEYNPLSNGLLPLEGSVQIDGQHQYYEARRFVLPIWWESEQEEFEVSNSGNEIAPVQNEIRTWQETYFEDDTAKWPEPYGIELSEGEQTLRFTLNQGETEIRAINIRGMKEIPTYGEYSSQNDNADAPEYIYTTEAERPSRKNSTSPRAMSIRDISATPYDTYSNLLNAFGSDTWGTTGQEIVWEIEVPTDGWYNISFTYSQSNKQNAQTFRTLRINGDLPFAEARSMVFNPSNSLQNYTLASLDGDAYEFYLTAGVHELSLEATVTPYRELITLVQDIIDQISDLGLEIRFLTGNNQDPNRDWVITDYIDGIDTNLNTFADNIETEMNELISTGLLESGTLASSNLKSAITRLRNLAKEPDRLPSRLTQLNEGTGSVNQVLSGSITELENQPLTLDRIYVHSNYELEDVSRNPFVSLVEGVKRFASSFLSSNELVEENTEAVNVWVNRSRIYVDYMQQMADSQFTPRTGIEVNFSLMPDESKLILANAGGNNPDVVLGVSANLPFDLAIRGSAMNLRQFDDFNEVARQFSPGALINYALDDGAYALPETQDFYVTLYRTDILNRIGVDVPSTWQDVIEILPELQRYGMNYYIPLSSESAMKPFMFTAPFIKQFGGQIYHDNGLSVALNEQKSIDAITFMSDLYTIYGLPLQVPSFYNEFRYGTIPIGIGTFGDYLQLRNAAPEISGSWEIALAPGLEVDGEVEPWMTGSAQGAMMFANTNIPQESWEFMKWWLGTETQTAFANQIQTLYGDEFVWNSANLEAFRQLPWPEEQKDIILEQWEYLFEAPRIPGGYMVERELSNTWNTIVFDDENPRSAIDEKTLLMNREIRRKMEEFEYISQNGEILKEFTVPDIDTIMSWLEED